MDEVTESTLAHLAQRDEHQRAEITRLRAELERVREALAPFAKAFREVPGSAWAHATAHIDDFRRAAQVMKEIEG